MKRILTSALLATSLTATAASAEAVIGYDSELAEQFAAERMIVDLVIDHYGPTAVFDTGDPLPQSVNELIVPRNPMPAGAPVEPVPSTLAGDLPHTEDGTRWAKVGKHLVEMAPDDTIVMVVYDVLP